LNRIIKEQILDKNHWRIADYSQRISTKTWKEILLSGADNIIYKGRYMRLKAKTIFPGVVEIHKERE